MDDAKVKQILDSCPDSVILAHASDTGDGDDETQSERVSVAIAFSERGFGFGEIVIVQTPKGVFIDTECMSRERVLKYLRQLVDGAITDSDTDHAKHALYNDAMGRRCAESCEACRVRS